MDIWEVINVLSEADVDQGYILEEMVKHVKETQTDNELAERLMKRWADLFKDEE